MSISDYPFTQEAAEHVRRAGYSLESLLDKSSFRPARSRAAERVLGAISGEISDRTASKDTEILAELLSYPLARIIVSCLEDQILIRRYALAEAKLAYRRMKNDADGILRLADDLGVHPSSRSDPLRIHFSEYISASHRMRDPKWKLVNRDLKDGYLTVTREELMRLMEEMVRDRVMKGLPLDVDPEICQRLREYIGPIGSELEAIKARQKIDLGRVEEGAFPPCIKGMLSQVSIGANLAHSARFALTSFLLQINMKVDDVIALFNTSPDFDEEQTRYQVEHIAGASGTRYTPPSCATMATYGNCPGEDELCKRIRHPLSYYERRIKYSIINGKKGKTA
jgi:DNA primase large subunit